MTFDKTKNLKIIPLGGLEEIGMNITALEYGDDIIVIDCGMSFPSDDMLGIDLVIPDITYLKENSSKVRGFFITHGHEDHIGAIPYVLRELNVPIFATRLTIALIANKCQEHGLLESAKLNVVSYGDTVSAGPFKVEFIRTNHSIADAAALAIFTPAGTVVHTGDFKVDFTPVFGDAIDLQRFGELGKAGVMALMCDSTNVIRDGFTMSESTVGRVFDTIFSENRHRRIIVATFASNVDRVQQIVNSAAKYGKKVVVEGRSMVNVMGTASELGYINFPEGTLIDIEEMKNYPDNEIVLITTGSQGETMAALPRMAADIHRRVSITDKDTIVFSSSPIPGNEKAVSHVINELSEKGARVIFQDTHVSGHACKEEIKMIYTLIKPKYSIPVHGEARHLVEHRELSKQLGIPDENIFVLHAGDVLELNEREGKVTGHVPAGGVLVDGLGVGDIGNIVLRDRHNLSENGIVIAVLTLNRSTGEVLAGPEVISRGFVYVRESEELIQEMREVVLSAAESCLNRSHVDWSRLKAAIRDQLSMFLWKKTKRDPIILPIIMEVDV